MRAKDAGPFRDRRRVLCAVFLAVDVLLALVLAAAVYRGSRQQPAKRDEHALPAAQEGLEESTAYEIGQALSLLTLRSEPTARNGRVAIYLSNDKDSRYSAAVTLLLADGTAAAHTGLIDPGYYLREMPLDRELSPGTYQCLAQCDFYDVQSGALLGTAARQVLLTVQPSEGEE